MKNEIERKSSNKVIAIETNLLEMKYVIKKLKLKETFINLNGLM